MTRTLSPLPLPKTLMELHAEKVTAARRELEAARASIDGSRASEDRYARALYELDLVQGMLPAVARGAGDVQA